MKTTEQEILNMIEMIGCNKSEFLESIKGYEKISMSSGGNYEDFYIFSGIKLLAIYNYKGIKQ